MEQHQDHCRHLPEQQSAEWLCQSTATVAVPHHDHLQDKLTGLETWLQDHSMSEWVTIRMQAEKYKNCTPSGLDTGLVREMVKTIVLREDPPFRKKTGDLFMYPPSPTLKDGVLFV